MKFGKEFASQMVQEWGEAYIDYNHLKQILKQILEFRKRNAMSSPSTVSPGTPKSSIKRRLTMYRAFSGLTENSPAINHEDEAILVNTMGPEDGKEAPPHYQTMFLKSSESGGVYELEYFEKVDNEFNKVVSFYSRKVEDVRKEAGELSKQMDALIALRVMVDKPVMGLNEEAKLHLAGAIQEEDFRPAPLGVLNNVRINVKPETPVSTLASVLKISNSELKYNRVELKKAEDQLKKAFLVFYHELRLLKGYCFLNTLAIYKIMKKYDKITSRKASRAYLEMVDRSCIGSSDEITRLLERTEATFIKHFANGNRRKGMSYLRPQKKREKHRNTFFLGLFSGCSLALVAAILVSIRARNLLEHEGSGQFMDNIFPLYSLFGFVVLHLLVYAVDIYCWRRCRINYTFIFGFKQGTELGYRHVLLLASAISVLALAAVLSHLDMEMDPKTRSFKLLTESVPLVLISVLFAIIFCPLNIVYRSNRFFLIKCVWRCICAPLFKVTLPDFFLADQFTSQLTSKFIWDYGLDVVIVVLVMEKKTCSHAPQLYYPPKRAWFYLLPVRNGKPLV
ncbi:unnamed protein product [Cuscuta epithymum]|uniref:SPX domain-containing protein n=2 Tax=Cuscuta epithymum TaxID=186058 RepID=A0AAV0FUC8_9ASTE|nr:unnamed protein product [Cuscuta epithymum]CAH9139292.1 unnamed protein product [Cuscuta epithymum]